MKMKNVLVILDSMFTSVGTESFLLNWISEAPRGEYRFIIYSCFDCADESYANLFRINGAKLIFGGANYQGSGLSKLKRYLIAYRDIGSLTKNNAIDIIHYNGSSPISAAIAMNRAKKNNVMRRICHSHNSTYNCNGVKKAAYNLARYFINKDTTVRAACSYIAAEFLFGHKYAKDTIIINNCIDTSKFAFSLDKRNSTRLELGMDNKLVIGQVARFAPQKNQHFLIDIFKKIHDLKKDTMLLFVGEGPLYAELKEYVDKLKLTENVIFTGNKSDPSNYYCAMDVFVLTSLYEGLPIVGIEAQASGLPCVFSENVTREVALCDDVTFISLNETVEHWSNTILSTRTNSDSDRCSAYKAIEMRGFGLNSIANMIDRLYKNEV